MRPAKKRVVQGSKQQGLRIGSSLVLLGDDHHIRQNVGVGIFPNASNEHRTGLGSATDPLVVPDMDGRYTVWRAHRAKTRLNSGTGHGGSQGPQLTDDVLLTKTGDVRRFRSSDQLINLLTDFGDFMGFTTGFG